MEGEGRYLKRKRVAAACKTCQKKKIRCDGNTPCASCIVHKLDCIVLRTRPKRRTRRGSKYLDGLEQRLKKMESLLNGSVVNEESNLTALELPDLQPSESRKGMASSAGIQVNMSSPPRSNNLEQGIFDESIALEQHDSPRIYDTIGKTTHGDFNSHNLPTLEQSPTPHSSHASPSSSEGSRMTDLSVDRDDVWASQSEEIQAVTSSERLLMPNRFGETPFVKPLAGLSIFSPRGIQSVIDRSGNKTFRDAIFAAARDENLVDYWGSNAFSSVFTRHVLKQLPPKEETISMVDEYFRDFNSVCPLFSQPVFMALVERQYSSKPPDSVGWWASLNAVLAITIGLHPLNNASPTLTEKSRDYLNNCLSVLTELIIRSTDLFAVQALLGMALFMQGMPDPRPTAFLIVSAIRLLHTLGLHKKDLGLGENFDPLEAEQRRRVFWIAYRLDNDWGIRSGLPLIQDSEDMNIELPSKSPEDELGSLTLPDGHGKTNIFRIMAEFAIIEAKVSKQLCSLKASKQLDEELLAKISELDHELEDWKERIPVDFQPEYGIKTSLYAPLSLHIIVLHFAYYNCLHTIHRTSIRHSYWTKRSRTAVQEADPEPIPLNPRVFTSTTLCICAARSSIRLIRYIPIHNLGFVWRVLYFPVGAFITLFWHVLQAPTGSRSRSDLRLMTLFVEFLSKLQHHSQEVARVFQVCAEIERISRGVLERAEKNENYQKNQNWSTADFEIEEQQSINRNTIAFSPGSATVAAGQGNNTPSMYRHLVTEGLNPTLDTLGSDTFSQAYLSIMSGALDLSGLNTGFQPMFPNCPPMPLDGSTSNSSTMPDYSNLFDFGFGMDR